jgi:hypothetical protein
MWSPGVRQAALRQGGERAKRCLRVRRSDADAPLSITLAVQGLGFVLHENSRAPYKAASAVRTREDLVARMDPAPDTVTASDAHDFFAQRMYCTMA